MAETTSQKPYLLRALFEWCVDNGYTPYLSVHVDERTRVPQEFVRNGEIVLNVGPLAANRLKMGNDFIDFTARFGGVGPNSGGEPMRAISCATRADGGSRGGSPRCC